MILSVIIPVYNAGPFIELCLDSIFAQPTANEVEVVLVDDGSTDDSWDRIKDWKRLHPSCPIQMFQKKHEGAASARNLGIQQASGKWLWMVDADDLVSPNATETLLKILPSLAIDLLKIGKLQTIPEKKQEVIPCNIDLSAIRPILTDTLFSPQSGCLDHTTYIFRKDFLIENGLSYPIGMTLLEDSIFMLEVLKTQPIVDFNPTLRFYHVRSHKKSTTRSQWNATTFGPYMNDIGLFFKNLRQTLAELCDKDVASGFWSRYVYVYQRVLAVKGVPWNFLENFRKQVFIHDDKDIKYHLFPFRNVFMRCRLTYRLFWIFCKIYKKIVC